MENGKMTHRARKIALVIPKYGLVGGAENFVSELTRHTAMNPRFNVHVFANRWLSNSLQVTFHKIPVIVFPKYLTTISFAHFVRRRTAKLDFDLIHTHDRVFEADIYTMHSVPHEFWIHEVRKKNMSIHDIATAWMEKTLTQNKRCRRFLSVSDLTKEKFLQCYDVDPGKVQVIHPGIEMDRFRGYDRERCRSGIRNLWGIGSDEFVILFVSMNFDIKGLDMVIASVAKTKMNHPSEKIKLLVVGKGEEKKYRLMAENAGIGNDVIFAGVHREKIEQIYLASDMFSILSKFDTFGIAVLEAMAASLPVVVSGNVGAKDLVRQGINGFVIEDRTDINSVSEKIGLLLNREARMKMGEAAHETALNNTWKSVAKKYEHIYDELLG